MKKLILLSLVMGTLLIGCTQKTDSIIAEPTQEVTEYEDPTVPKPFVLPDYLDNTNDYNPSSVSVSTVSETTIE